MYINLALLPSPYSAKNKGSTLAISLVLLTVITLVAIFSLQRSGLQSKIVTNIQHVEMLFNTALNDQEYWFVQLKIDDSGDDLLAEPLANFWVDENNQRQYLAITLEENPDDLPVVSLASHIVHIPPQQGQLSLSEGNEVNSRMDYKFELASQAGIEQRGLVARQKTGISFPGLNNQQNSLY